MGLGGGIGLGLTGMTTHAALIADAYVRRRGLATGIAFGGSMAAYALAGPAQWIITNWGWRPAFRCYAAAILALIPWVWRVHPTRLPSAADRGTTELGPTRATASRSPVVVRGRPPGPPHRIPPDGRARDYPTRPASAAYLSRSGST
jgi:predicted MFS family arabinose efflux permease